MGKLFVKLFAFVPALKVTDNNLEKILDERKKYKGSIRGIKEVLSDLEIENKIYRLTWKNTFIYQFLSRHKKP